MFQELNEAREQPVKAEGRHKQDQKVSTGQAMRGLKIHDKEF